MKIESTLEKIVFASRWLQAPLYVGLILAGILYTYKFFIELLHLLASMSTITESALMLGILTLIGFTMVANLLVMVIIGGYSTFVSRLEIDSHVDKPEWLQKVDAGTLKVKLAGALVGISGIHLLQIFINMENKNPDVVMWQIIIHVVFLFTALSLAYTESIMHRKYK